MESVKQLYYVITTKQLFLEWLLEINKFIGRKLCRKLAIEELNEFVQNNKSIDLRTAPDVVKKHTIYDEDILKMRWDLCSSCEFLKDDICSQCGCLMKIKYKLTIAECPIGKWGKYGS